MSITPGTYALGPDDGELVVRTGKAGAAARAGHNLTIAVTRWSATARLADDPASSELTLTADSRSLSVLEGSGGMQALGDDDKEGISQTIDEEVLKGTEITFRSTAVAPAGENTLSVTGDLTLSGQTRPVTFSLTVDGERVTGEATVTQSDFGMKPYSALFGTLKVADDVVVTLDARLAPAG